MMSDDDILAIVSSELSLSDSSTYNGIGNVSLEESLSMYLGLPDGREIEGRSQIVSTDIADAIEWIMPQIMKSFTQTNEVVIFDPVNGEDEKQAELESEYTYSILMKQNNGFVLLHQFVKDALMQRNGILKVYYEKEIEETTAEYTGVTNEMLQVLMLNPEVEILELTQNEFINEGTQQLEVTSDIKVKYSHENGRIVVEAVPPEEFRVNAQHNSICLEKARFTAHVVLTSASDLVKGNSGLSKEEIAELPEGSNYYDREYRFTMQNESVYYDRVDTGDDSERIIEIAECFMRMDIDEDGVSELVKIRVAGGDSPSQLLSVEEIDSMPWISTTAILMSHKFQGLSITDRLKEIQEQKTTLWRNMFDNMYLQNNQRYIILEGQVKTDDLLVSRPGGLIRAKRLDAVQPLVTPQLGQDAYNMMTYLDEVRAGRVGVSPEGNATPQNIGENVGSEGLDRLMNSKEELVGLIIRVITETGIKPLCIKIRDLAVKHLDAVKDYKFRGQWTQVNPATWGDRELTTVRVGTGTGDRNKQVASLREVMMLQEKTLANPGQAILNEQKVFDTIDDFCKFSGLIGATKYFIDPSSDEGQQQRKSVDESSKANQEKQDQTQQIMMKAQTDVALAELGKAQAQSDNVKLKNEVDQGKNQIQFLKAKYEAELKVVQNELEETKVILNKESNDDELQFKYDNMISQVGLELTRIEKDSEKKENENLEENIEDAREAINEQ